MARRSIGCSAPANGVGTPAAYRASDGAAYDWFLGRWTRRLAVPFLDFVCPPGDGTLLEVGCGTGSLASQIAQRHPAQVVVGVDLALPYLLQAQHNAPHCLYAVSDAERLPFADDAFAVGLAQLVLNFLPDPAAAVAEMKRVTRPGGVLAAAVWDFRGGLVYQRLFWDSAAGIDPAAGNARDRLFATPLAGDRALATLWTAAGLHDVATGSLTVRMDYESFDDYWQPLLGGQGPVGSYAAGLADQRLDQVRDKVRLAYLAGGADGPRSMTATAWAVRGTI
jgi:SAM-dependent methyltransferase